MRLQPRLVGPPRLAQRLLCGALPRCRSLEVVSVGHNQLSALPPLLLGLPGLKELLAGHNQIHDLLGNIHLMEGLQVSESP